jgi:hypothetical protein
MLLVVTGFSLRLRGGLRSGKVKGPLRCLLGNRHASFNLPNNLGISPTELPGAAKVVTLSNVSGRTVPKTRDRFGEKVRNYLRGCFCGIAKRFAVY